MSTISGEVKERDLQIGRVLLPKKGITDTVIHKNVSYQKLTEVDFMCGIELKMKGVKYYKNLLIGNRSY